MAHRFFSTVVGPGTSRPGGEDGVVTGRRPVPEARPTLAPAGDARGPRDRPAWEGARGGRGGVVRSRPHDPDRRPATAARPSQGPS